MQCRSENARAVGAGASTDALAGLAGLASTYAGFGLRLDYLAEHAARLAGATIDDVARAAATYLAPARAVSIVLGDADEVESALSGITPLVRVPGE